MQGLLSVKTPNYFTFNEVVVHGTKWKNYLVLCLLVTLLHMRNNHQLVCAKCHLSSNKRNFSYVIASWRD
jgi:hypothetical protein